MNYIGAGRLVGSRQRSTAASRFLTPYASAENVLWQKGTAHAVRQYFNFVREFQADYVLDPVGRPYLQDGLPEDARPPHPAPGGRDRRGDRGRLGGSLPLRHHRDGREGPHRRPSRKSRTIRSRRSRRWASTCSTPRDLERLLDSGSAGGARSISGRT
ncbi:MAG: hypothetical protein MZU97_06825 [Bacillus subtilis]|nr:hypothetical protein [Bacillus subtilis]